MNQMMRLVTLAVCVLLSAVAACGGSEPPCTGEKTSCEPRDVSGVNLIDGGSSTEPAFGPDPEAASVEETLEMGFNSLGQSPVHIAFRGVADVGSTRCEWNGVARTLDHREEEIRFWLGIEEDVALPTAEEVERRLLVHVNGMRADHQPIWREWASALARGGHTAENTRMKCYVDYEVSEYILGAGPLTLTVAYERGERGRSYDLYSQSHAAGKYGGAPRLSQAEFAAALVATLADAEMEIGAAVEGRESVVMMSPMGAHYTITVEAWQAVAQWDLQTDDGTVNAVRYGSPEGDPERTQTLANLKSRVTTAAASDAFADDRIANVSGLNQYYRDIGAYGDITPDDGSTAMFTPSQPPPVYVYAPAPSDLSVTASGTNGADLTWDEVSDKSGYHVQHRTGGDEEWATLADVTTGASYAASDLRCGRTHEFRVGAYGDGATYSPRVGLWSDAVTLTTVSCEPRAPMFSEASYSFETAALAEVGAPVGTVSAVDLNGDTVTYSITAGNGDGRFAIGSVTGEITVTASLRGLGDIQTLTVGAGDGVSGTTSVTVTIRLTAMCGDGIAVSGPSNSRGLVGDCEVLLAARDELAGTGTLDWSGNTAIADWEGVTVGGTPRRVTELNLDGRGLTGSIPGGLGDLSALDILWLHRNALTGAIPPELGGLSDLTWLVLSDNRLSGSIPRELGGLTDLMQLWLLDNQLSGPIPRELGALTDLIVLQMQDNRLSGPIPPELGDLTSRLVLRLAGNRLEGCIPPVLRRFEDSDLPSLRLPFCTESGRISAPSGPSVTLSGGTFAISWSAVSGAAEYEVQHRTDAESSWTALAAVDTTSATYSPVGGPDCGTMYEFRVRAYGDGTTHIADWGEESDAESVTTDVCNRPPEFDVPFYSFSIDEDAGGGTVVGTVDATDPDAGDTVTYTITAGNEDGRFAIGSSTGEITVAGGLDHETTESYTLTVEATDGRGGTSTSTVEIGIGDVPEDLPPAPQDVEVSLSGGEFTINWTAVSGAAEYEVQHRSDAQSSWTALAAVDTTSATYGPADGPACGTRYEFRVRAYGDGTTYTADWGAESSVVAHETDACNRPPEFGVPSYSFSIDEDAGGGTVVGTVTATDPDAGDTVTYTITAGNEDGRFAIGSSTGEITVAGGLDHETTERHTLTVEATDGRGGTSTSTVEIGIGDVPEDLPPAPQDVEVSLPGGEFTISWTAVSGAAEYEVQHRSDAQSSWTALAAVDATSATYSPADGPACGTTYEFRVRAYGDGTTYTADWGAESSVVAHETDACNRPPEFGSPTYMFDVDEDAAATTTVGTVSATDPDQGDTVTYTITAGNEDGRFAIGISTGEITVTGGLDHETTESHTLTVEATDGRGGTSTATVEIEIGDVPEDLPFAPRDVEVSLSGGEFAISWSVVSGAAEYEVQHRTDAQSSWTALAAVDATSATYSPADGPACGTTYEFRVRAYGDGTTYIADWGEESDTESVTTDACNRPPEFGVPSYSFSVDENAGGGTVVGTVEATDPDAGDTVTYSITAGNEDGRFAIGRSTGEITVAAALDYETTDSYTLTVEADDGNGGTDTATATVTVANVPEDLELWSGTMTAGAFTIGSATAYGYTTGVTVSDTHTGGPHGTLDETTFTYGGETYTVELAVYVEGIDDGPSSFLVGLEERHLPEDAQLALDVNGHRLRLAAWRTTGMSSVDTMYYYVSGIDFTLSEGQEATLSLKKTNPSSDTGLASLVLGMGILSPEFDADTGAYAATVANDVSVETVTAEAASDYATVSVSPEVADDVGTEGVEVALEVGENTIIVTVTAEDGTTRDYTVTITREAG